MEIELVTPKLNDRERREVTPGGNNCQINPSTETQNETVKEESFERSSCASTEELITTNTNNKSRSTKIPEPKVTTQTKRDSLVETNDEKKVPHRSTASTSQNATERRY